MAYLLPFWGYLAGPESTSSTHQLVRTGYEDKYRSRSYRFVERQNECQLLLELIERFAAEFQLWVTMNSNRKPTPHVLVVFD